LSKMGHRNMNNKVEPRIGIDLRECKKGDLLISCHGLPLTYSYYDKALNYPHIVLYPPYGAYGEYSEGSRTDNGQAFNNNKSTADHDIVLVIRRGKIIQRKEW
jgi:hypothetical protein